MPRFSPNGSNRSFGFCAATGSCSTPISPPSTTWQPRCSFKPSSAIRSAFLQTSCFNLQNRNLPRLRSPSVTSSWGGRRTAPYACTEQGVAMLSSVLNSSQAIAANIEIMRAFVRLRQMLAANKELARRLDELEARTDAAFATVFQAIRQLMTPPEPKKRPIGFVTPGENND